MAYCKNCGVEVVGQFCAECGTSKGNGNNFCGGCGGKNDKPDWKFCVHCGEKNTVAAAPANACSCGQVYLPNAKFCPSCGEPRPGLANSGGVDSGPAPGLPKRRAAPPPPIPGRPALNTSNDGLKTSPRGNNGASNGWNQQQTQTVEVSSPQPWSPPRSAPTPINTTTSSYNTAPQASSPVYNSSPSQFAIPAAPPQPAKEEKKKKSLKDKLKAKLVGGGWLIDKNAPAKTSTPASESPKSPKPLSTSPSSSSGNKDVTTNRILEHIQKNYNEPSPGTSPQMSTSPRNASPISTPSTNNYVTPSPPTRPAVTPAVNNTTPPPPTRPTAAPTATVNTAPPPPPSKPTPPPAPTKTKEELIPKKEGEVVLTGSSFGKQPAVKPIQKVNVPPPPPGIKNKDNRMSLNTILAESTNYDGSMYQATIISYEDRADAIDTSKKVTLYKIAVAQGGKNWAVFRRVAQFEELDKRLKKKGALGPNEGSVKKKKEKDQMLQELEKYLVLILSKPETAGHHYVHNFLQPTQIGDVKAT